MISGASMLAVVWATHANHQFPGRSEDAASVRRWSRAGGHGSGDHRVSPKGVVPGLPTMTAMTSHSLGCTTTDGTHTTVSTIPATRGDDGGDPPELGP